MRVYNIVLVTVAVIVFFSNDVIAATSAQNVSLAPVNNEVKTARFLRSENEAATFEEEDTLTEDEDRMYGLKPKLHYAGKLFFFPYRNLPPRTFLKPFPGQQRFQRHNLSTTLEREPRLFDIRVVLEPLNY
ncbi:unnamed protein product [Phytophthora lilii]|uniref:RxLR effector protein n=1 Tax=Phytophthora lilii TaxID=2077276 RepID=A0A9W7D9D7_9STRA|nr:unnamed protein product [Phytophthora lilii]